jgi:hypothetical protein
MPEDLEVQSEETTPSPQIFSVDDIILEDEGGKEKKEPDVEVEVEKKETISTDKSEVAELKKQLQELQGDLLKVSTTEREPKRKEESKKEKLSRAQLVQLMKEHKDDPEVLYNISEYIAEQLRNCVMPP